MSKANLHTPGFSMAMFSQNALLGGITPQQFLAEYWQKKPLLVRQALPGFGNWLDRAGLSALACRDDAESRLVQHKRGRWLLEHGPFEPEDLDDLPKKGWSLLVSGVNHLLAQGNLLLDAFDFVPRARLDDLMVSFAPDGGGVGPHFDSYDVFLIQGLGRRRWEISEQSDLTLVEGAPLRILQNFPVSQSWELEPGDMLYLPPRFAHNGVALGDCMTWSVGFRAPKADEIVSQFFNYLQDHGLQDNMQLEGMYSDPDLQYTSHAGEIPEAMLAWTSRTIEQAHWKNDAIADFLGRYLSEPKAHVFFAPPARPMSLEKFRLKAEKHGVRLDPRSQFLYRNRDFFMNGEHLRTSSALAKTLRKLADRRTLSAAALSDPGMQEVLYEWYCAGYLITG